MSKQIIYAEYENDSLLQNAVDYLCSKGVDHDNIKVETPGENLAEQIYKDPRAVFLGSASSLTNRETLSSPESIFQLYPIVKTVRTIGLDSMHPRSFEANHRDDNTAPRLYISTKKSGMDNVRSLLKDTNPQQISHLN